MTVEFSNPEAPSFAEFAASKEWSSDIAEEIGFDDGEPRRGGYIYMGNLYIEYHCDREPDGVGGYWFLVLERDYFTSEDRSQLEARLYVYGLDSGAFKDQGVE